MYPTRTSQQLTHQRVGVPNSMGSLPGMLQFNAGAPIVPAAIGGRQHLGLDHAAQDATLIQQTGKRDILEVTFAAQSLDGFYMQIKPEWNGLKGSMETLLNDLDHLLPRYFKQKGEPKKTESTPTAKDVIDSYNTYPSKNDWIGKPLIQFLKLLNSLKQIVPFLTQTRETLIRFDFQKPLTDTLKEIVDLVEGKKKHDKTHKDVSAIIKDLKLSEKKRIYIPLISTVPFVLDDMYQVQEQLKVELQSMGERNVAGNDVLGVPVMLQAAATTGASMIQMGLIDVDAQAISLYRNHSKKLERQLILMKNMMLDQLQIQQWGNFGLDTGPIDHDVGHGTDLEKMLRKFDQKVSICMLKDATQINFATSIFAAGIFDSEGGNLAIKDSGVNLFIPSGAIPRGTRKEIYIYLDPDTHLKLENRKETRVAPIIHCGPPGTSFDAPFVLSFPHCAEDEDQWTFSGLIQDSGTDDQWQDIENDSDGISLVQGGHCIIMIDHFTKFTLKGATQQQEGAKLIKMCTFGKSYDRSNSYSFNVRAWNPHDQETVMTEQYELDETRMDSIKTLKVQNTGKDVKVYLANIQDGWVSEYEDEMEISHEELWYEPEDGTPPSRRFRLHTKDSKQQESVHCRVKSKQDGSQNEIALEVIPPKPLVQQVTHSPMRGAPQKKETKAILVAYRREFGPLDNLELPPQICHELCRQLDIKEVGLRDWRGLAEQLGCGKMIEIFDKNSSAKSPTANLLNILSRISAPGEFCKKLCEKLKAARIDSAYALIQRHLQTQEINYNL